MTLNQRYSKGVSVYVSVTTGMVSQVYCLLGVRTTSTALYKKDENRYHQTTESSKNMSQRLSIAASALTLDGSRPCPDAGGRELRHPRVSVKRALRAGAASCTCSAAESKECCSSPYSNSPLLGGRFLFLGREAGLPRNMNLPLTVFLDLAETGDQSDEEDGVRDLRIGFSASLPGENCSPNTSRLAVRFQRISACSVKFIVPCDSDGTCVPVKLSSAEFENLVTRRPLDESWSISLGVCAGQHLQFKHFVRLCSSKLCGVVHLDVNGSHVGNAALSLNRLGTDKAA